MAFNLGAFASGAAKGYLSSKELEEKEKDREMRQQALDIQKAQADREQARYQREREAEELLKNAYTPDTGGVSTRDITGALPIGQRAGETETTPEYRQAFQTAFDNLTPQQQAAVLQGYGSANTPGGQAAAAIPELKAAQLGTTTVRKGEDGQTYAAQPLGEREALVRYKQMAGASGNTAAVEKANQLYTQSLQTKQLERGDKRADKEDKFYEWLGNSQEMLLTQGPDAAAEALAKEYNTGKEHKDGFTAKIVKNQDGSSAFTITNDKTGEVKSAYPVDEKNMNQAIEFMAFQKWSAIPGNFKEALTEKRENTKLGFEGRRVKTEEDKAAESKRELDAKINAGLFEAQAGQARASANSSNAHAAVYKNMVKLANSNAAAGEVMKPYIEKFSKLTPEQQAGTEGQALLTEAAAAAAKKTGDITGILNALKKPDRAAVTPEERTNAYQDLREAGSNPDAIAAVKEKWPNVFGEDPMVTLFKNAQGNTNKAKGGDNKTKSAIPTKSTSGSHAATDVYKQTPQKNEKDLRAEWVDLSQRQKLVGISPEAQAKNMLRMREIEQTLAGGVPQTNKFIKTN
jgi:hypothetical protein